MSTVERSQIENIPESSSLHGGRHEELRRLIRGQVLQPRDEGYEEARQVWNGMIDRRPAVIARCTGNADVMAAVRYARQRSIPISVRGGGHNVSGNSLIEGGLVIDLSSMRNVRVDRQKMVVQAAGGALLGDVDHETQAFGLATPLGAVSTTGVAGLALHGGLGFLTRKYGLTADNLISAEVVTSNGELIRADENEHADLFWALRGGGSSFGVVTSFDFRLHPVGPEVWMLIVYYPADEGEKVIEVFQSFMPDAPDELMAIALYWNAPEEEPIPELYRGAPVIAIAGCWCGPLEEGDHATRPLREIGKPILDLSGVMPFIEAQRLFDPEYPAGGRYFWKSHYLPEITDEVNRLARKIAADRPTPISTVELWALGGAMGRISPESSAYYHRKANWLFTIEANSLDPNNDESLISWVRNRYEETRRFSTGGTYLNFAGFLEEGEDLLAKSFGENYPRIIEIKAKYDPDTIFQHNLKIPVKKEAE
jgi:FAD/FMN-containing dehydrogenase